jgi:hypothetical protein
MTTRFLLTPAGRRHNIGDPRFPGAFEVPGLWPDVTAARQDVESAAAVSGPER